MKQYLTLFLILLTNALFSQAVSIDDAKLFNPTYKLGRDKFENYAYKIKQIDEFIERFNNSDKSLLRKYQIANNQNLDGKRIDVYRQLFNKSQTWKVEDIRDFYRLINNKFQPVYISFYDKDWYAEVTCDFLYQSKKQTVTLKLKVLRTGENSSRWTIFDVSEGFLSKYPNDSFPSLSANADVRKSLSPASHGTNFLKLEKALSDKENMRVFFDESFFIQHHAPFMRELMNGNLIFQQVNQVKYHFLQVKDWVFVVEKFNRQSNNSGWLISKLLKVSEEEKKGY